MTDRDPAPLPLQLSVVPTAMLTDVERAEIVTLCTRAFAQDFSTLFDLIALATQPVHVVARLGNVLVGHACWTTRVLQPGSVAPLRTAYVDAVATDPAYQGRGIGSRVMARLMAEVLVYDLGGLATNRVTFYERLGWERWLGPIAVRTSSGIIPTPNDTAMILRTPRTPALDLESTLIAEWRAGQPW